MCAADSVLTAGSPAWKVKWAGRSDPCTCSTCPPASSLPGCREVYEAASPGYRGRCTAPLVIDKLQRRLVSNESADILRMLNSMQLPGASNVDLYPAEHRAEIDAINDLVYNKVWLGSEAA